MKLTRSIKRFVQRERNYYCVKMSIFTDKPKIILTDKAFNKLKKTGAAIRDDNEIYINTKHHKTAGDLIDTIVHELVHIKYPKLKHGRKFQEKVNRIMMS